jgi:hypothetical protein
MDRLDAPETRCFDHVVQYRHFNKKDEDAHVLVDMATTASSQHSVESPILPRTRSFDRARVRFTPQQSPAHTTTEDQIVWPARQSREEVHSIRLTERQTESPRYSVNLRKAMHDPESTTDDTNITDLLKRISLHDAIRDLCKEFQQRG